MQRGEKRIIPQTSGQRLDKYLSDQLSISRSKAKKLIESFMVKVNDKDKTAHYITCLDDVVSYSMEELVHQDALNMIPDIKYIYKDEDIIAIDKEPGITVHPAPGTKTPTVLEILENTYESPEIVHRLDKDTSGILLVALNERSAYNLRSQFKQRTVKKIYKALLKGRLEDSYGEIDIPIRRSRRDPTKMTVGWSQARHSTTRYKVIEYLDEITFTEIYLLTGRTHQIRVHFAYEGHPVLGDSKYGVRQENIPRQMLHAASISFEHPSNGKRINLESDLPEDFKIVLEKYR